MKGWREAGTELANLAADLCHFGPVRLMVGVDLDLEPQVRSISPRVFGMLVLCQNGGLSTLLAGDVDDALPDADCPALAECVNAVERQPLEPAWHNLGVGAEHPPGSVRYQAEYDLEKKDGSCGGPGLRR
jgi:hypothetical protein